MLPRCWASEPVYLRLLADFRAGPVAVGMRQRSRRLTRRQWPLRYPSRARATAARARRCLAPTACVPQRLDRSQSGCRCTGPGAQRVVMQCRTFDSLDRPQGLQSHWLAPADTRRDCASTPQGGSQEPFLPQPLNRPKRYTKPPSERSAVPQACGLGVAGR